jgi:hypothetical protein
MHDEMKLLSYAREKKKLAVVEENIISNTSLCKYSETAEKEIHTREKV